MDFSISDMNSSYLDVLKEISNIGSGSAATSLANMLGGKVDMKVPNVEVVQTQSVVDLFEDMEEVTVGVYINFVGDINGTILTILDMNSAGVINKKLLGQKPDGFLFTEMEVSVMQELGNIMSSGYVNAISRLSNLNFSVSIPSVTIDMVSSILSVPAVEYGVDSDKLILIENMLDIEGENVNCYFLFMPDIPSFDKLFKSLGVL